MSPSGRHYDIRPARRADQQALRELIFGVLAEYGLDGDPGDRDADLFDVEGYYGGLGSHFDILVDDVGSLCASVALLRIDDTSCELRKMYLLPELRGLGLGRRLLDHALGQARRDGYRRVVLETNSALVEAIGLYHAYGFRPDDSACHSGRCDQAMVLELGEEQAGC